MTVEAAIAQGHDDVCRRTRGRTACNGVFDESYPVTCKTEEHPEEHFQFTVTLDKSSGKRMGWVGDDRNPEVAADHVRGRVAPVQLSDWNNEHPDKA